MKQTNLLCFLSEFYVPRSPQARVGGGRNLFPGLELAKLGFHGALFGVTGFGLLTLHGTVCAEFSISFTAGVCLVSIYI